MTLLITRVTNHLSKWYFRFCSLLLRLFLLTSVKILRFCLFSRAISASLVLAFPITLTIFLFFSGNRAKICPNNFVKSGIATGFSSVFFVSRVAVAATLV